jgi:mycothiol synthase
MHLEHRPALRRRLPLAAEVRQEGLAARRVLGQLLGVHWTKRRTSEIGEVHNLALHPDVQGRGLGGPLLDAGLAHLEHVGCREVILWVDARNAPALALYRSRGFSVRWDDVALDG